MSLLGDTGEFIKQNIGTIGAGVGGLALGGAVGYLAGSKSSRTSSGRTKRRKNTKSRKVHSRVRKTPRTAGKGRDTSTRRIRYTKNGQPYIIMSSGKAKFISKRGAKASHKRKGGRY